MKWTWTFDSHGGYDCMTAAYLVWRGDQYVMKIDTADFVGEGEVEYELLHEPHPEAEALARAICQRMDGL